MAEAVKSLEDSAQGATAPAPSPGRSKIALDLIEYRARNGKGWKQLTRELNAASGANYSSRSVRAWAGGAVTEYTEPFETAAKKYLEAVAYRRRRPFRTLKRYRTRLRAIFSEALETAAAGKIALLYGSPGVGKTFGVLAESAEYESVFVNAYRKIRGKAFFKAFADELGLGIEHGFVDKYMAALVDHLSEQEQPSATILIADEANYLDLVILDRLRWIWDECKRKNPGSCGIVLVGTNRIKFTLEAASERDISCLEAEQLRRRISYEATVPGFDRELVPELAEEILGKVKIPEAALNQIIFLCEQSEKADQSDISIGRLEALLAGLKLALEKGDIAQVTADSALKVASDMCWE